MALDHEPPADLVRAGRDSLLFAAVAIIDKDRLAHFQDPGVRSGDSDMEAASRAAMRAAGVERRSQGFAARLEVFAVLAEKLWRWRRRSLDSPQW